MTHRTLSLGKYWKVVPPTLTEKPVAFIQILTINFSLLHFNVVQRWMRADFRQKRQNSPKLRYIYADIYRSFVYNSSGVIMKAI